MAELEELEQEDLDAQLLEVGNPVADELPSVPSAEPSKGKFPSALFHGKQSTFSLRHH